MRKPGAAATWQALVHCPSNANVGCLKRWFRGQPKKTHDTALLPKRSICCWYPNPSNLFSTAVWVDLVWIVSLSETQKKHFLVFNFCQAAAGGLQDFFWAFRLSLFHLLLLFCVNPKSLRFAFLFLKKRLGPVLHTLGVRNLSPQNTGKIRR